MMFMFFSCLFPSKVEKRPPECRREMIGHQLELNHVSEQTMTHGTNETSSPNKNEIEGVVMGSNLIVHLLLTNKMIMC